MSDPNDPKNADPLPGSPELPENTGAAPANDQAGAQPPKSAFEELFIDASDPSDPDDLEPLEVHAQPKARRAASRRGLKLYGHLSVLRSVPVFRRSDVVRSLCPNDPKRAFNNDTEADEGSTGLNILGLESHEDRKRTLLRSMLQDRANGTRSMLDPDPAMIARLEALAVSSPGFADVTHWILRFIRLAAATGAFIAIPPFVLVAKPGIGKTHYLNQLARALATKPARLDLNMLTDHGDITGLSESWKAARMGIIAKTLIEGTGAQPLFIFDEFDKVPEPHPKGNPFAAFHSIFEPENAQQFQDEFLRIPIDASHAFYAATANSLWAVPDSILDRLVIFGLPEPTIEQKCAIVLSIFRAENTKHRGYFDEPGDDLLASLAWFTPRRLTKLIPAALAFAVEAGRKGLVVEDLVRVEAAFL